MLAKTGSLAIVSPLDSLLDSRESFQIRLDPFAQRIALGDPSFTLEEAFEEPRMYRGRERSAYSVIVLAKVEKSFKSFEKT